jgi:hypothetical protein
MRTLSLLDSLLLPFAALAAGAGLLLPALYRDPAILVPAMSPP